MHQLSLAVGLGPGQVAALFDQRQKGGQEGATDILRKGKVGLPVAVFKSSKKIPPTPRARPRCGTKKYSSAQALNFG